MKFRRIKTLHFVGIGGVGMCGIAEVLHNSGYQLTGSDMKNTETTSHLEELGIKIYYSHSPENVIEADLVVTSSAVNDENPEVAEARSRKIPVIRRAEMLAELMRMKFSIAVAGTHGKTTTSSLIGHFLKEAGLDPTVIVGGRVLGVGSNAYLGKSEYLVAEADEFDRSINKFSPVVSVITNIEPEHMECYADLDDLDNCFIEFANRVPFFGRAVICRDDPGIQRIEQRITRPVITYGLSREADFSAGEIKFDDRGATFSLYHDGIKLTTVRSPLQGFHNILNMLAAFSVAYDLDIPLETVAPAAETFTGVGRRMEYVGEVGGVKFYDDYGHHPTEIKASLQGMRAAFNGRLVAVFQPHLYSRTQKYYSEFGRSFSDADLVVVLDVYPSREKPVAGISGQLIVDAAAQAGHKDIYYLENKEELPEYLKSKLKKGDRVTLFGAGDVNKFTKKIMDLMKD